MRRLVTPSFPSGHAASACVAVLTGMGRMLAVAGFIERSCPVRPAPAEG